MDIQGHRGCRGLLPENTIAGFVKAIELGVNTIEMDVVVTKDKKVIVSHEPYFNHEITTLPDGSYLNPQNDKSYNIYQMTYEEVLEYDVGLKKHPRFPDQQNMPATKPLLADVIRVCDALSNNKIRYNIEIKRKKEYDGQYHPDAYEFTDLLLALVKENNIQDRTTIQSFDHESLIAVHRNDPKIKTVILVEDILSADSHIDKLGFTPYGYSPYYKLVNNELVAFCQKKKIKLIPWTVNEEEAIKTILAYPTDGIITDYPNKVIDIIKKNK